MPFVEHVQQRIFKTSPDSNKEIVRVRITKTLRKYRDPILMLKILVGHKVGEKLDLKEEDRILFFYDTDNPRKWMIKKSNNPDKGYKIIKKNPKIMKNYLQIALTFMIPDYPFRPSDFKLQIVSWEVSDGNLIIYNP